MTERIHTDLADRMGRFVLYFNHFCLQAEIILAKIADIIMIEYVHIPCQQDSFTYPQQIDSFRNVSIPYPKQAAGCTAGDVLQLSADPLFDVLCHRNQLLQLLDCRKD